MPVDEKRAYRPIGPAMNGLFYFKGPMMVLSGPAGTGKSRCALEKIHLCMEKYAGARAVIFRKTRESLSESALFTFEEKVLPEGHPVLAQGGQRRTRQNYLYPNGSEIHVVGLDKPGKIMSTEFDMAYGQELIECDPVDISFVSTRLRNGVMPYQQLIGDTNPDKPTHWLKIQADANTFPMIDTYHEDNPLWFEEAPLEGKAGGEGTDWPIRSYDGRWGQWTKQGIDYILGRLENLKGADYWRLRHGKWVGAEGAVYKDWDVKYNVLRADAGWGRLPQSWKRFWSIDFGFTHPFVWGQWAVDGDGRMFLELELYVTKTLVRDAMKAILRRVGWTVDDYGERRALPGAYPWPEAIICDWDAEGRATVEQETGMSTTSAYKDVEHGIQAVAERIVPAADGYPRLFILDDSLTAANGPGPDDLLVQAMKPTCTAAEVPGYVWDIREGQRKGERPIGKDDHGCDMKRYAVCYEDNIIDKPRAEDYAQAAEAAWMPVSVKFAEPERGALGVMIGGRH